MRILEVVSVFQMDMIRNATGIIVKLVRRRTEKLYVQIVGVTVTVFQMAIVRHVVMILMVILIVKSVHQRKERQYAKMKAVVDVSKR